MEPRFKVDGIQRKTLQAENVSPNTNRTQAAERAKNAVFVPGDIDLWPLTLTFKLVSSRLSEGPNSSSV